MKKGCRISQQRGFVITTGLISIQLNQNGLIVLPPLPLGHKFVVTSSLMQMLTTRGFLWSSIGRSTWSHGKLRSVCKSCVRRPELDMDVIGFKVFPLSLTGDVTVWFVELSYKSIHTWDQLHRVFIANYFWCLRR